MSATALSREPDLVAACGKSPDRAHFDQCCALIEWQLPMLLRHPVFGIAVPEPVGIVLVQSANVECPQTWSY